jgi:hypothetical protein
MASLTTEYVSQDVSETVQSIAPQIASLWDANRDNLFKIGRMLVEAKGSTEHGEWLNAIDACEAFPFKQRTAQRLMKIAQFDTFQNVDVYAALPPSILALDTIVSCAKDKVEKLRQLVADGHITPESNVFSIKAAFADNGEIKPTTLVRRVSDKKLASMQASGTLAAYIDDLYTEAARAEKFHMPKAA